MDQRLINIPDVIDKHTRNHQDNTKVTEAIRRTQDSGTNTTTAVGYVLRKPLHNTIRLMRPQYGRIEGEPTNVNPAAGKQKMMNCSRRKQRSKLNV